MNKKIVMTALLAATVLCGSVFASSTAKTVKGNGADVTIRGAVVGYYQGNTYIMDDGAGHRIRADLGANGGRLLTNNAFLASGQILYDTYGPILKVHHINYTDPDPLRGPSFSSSGSSYAAGGQTAQAERDPAFYHGPAESNDQYTYINGQSIADPQDYRDVSAGDIAGIGNGSKVAITGRAISTYAQDQMNFWDNNGQNVILVMNGTYIPLGQRCRVLGVVQNGKVVVLHIDSVA